MLDFGLYNEKLVHIAMAFDFTQTATELLNNQFLKFSAICLIR